MTAGPGGLEDIGINMINASSAYESKKPIPEGKDADPLVRQLGEKNWEVSLLRSQLEEAETKIRELTAPKKKKD
jgi:hypothetical protein